MGCCSSKLDEFNSNDYFVYSIETTLKVSVIPYNLFYNQCLRHSAGNSMSFSQFKAFCEILKISHSSKDARIMSSFRDAATYSIPCARLLTFHILVTGGNKEDKVDQLFNVYDICNEGKLYEDNIKTMVADIYEVAVESLLKLAVLSAEKIGSDSVSAYYTSLRNVKTTVIFYLFHHFIDEKDFLDLKMFKAVFFTIEMNVLLVPRLLRKFCFKIYLDQKETFNESNNGSISGDVISVETMRRFKRRLTE